MTGHLIFIQHHMCRKVIGLLSGHRALLIIPIRLKHIILTIKDVDLILTNIRSFKFI